VNQVVLDGLVVERRALRYTPAGIAALDFVIAHESVQTESAVMAAGGGRHPGQRISLQLSAMAFGPLATQINEASLDSRWTFEGHLAAKPARAGVTSKAVRLHVQAARRTDT
jgi:primosomal replication protein N